MEGWRPVADLTRWGFAHAQVVMANEAHDGLRRCVRTREVGISMIRAAHQARVRRNMLDPYPALGREMRALAPADLAATWPKLPLIKEIILAHAGHPDPAGEER